MCIRDSLDRSDSLLLKELETVKELPKKGELKSLLEDIAITVAGKKGRPREAKTTLEAAILKLGARSIDEGEVEAKIASLCERLAQAYFNYFITRDKNLWCLNPKGNVLKLQTEFLTWVTATIMTRNDKETMKNALTMSEYLYYWYERLKGEEALSFSDFLLKFRQKSEHGFNPFEVEGFLKGLVQEEPEFGEPFRTICVQGRSYTFAESLDIWYIKTHAPDMRTEQCLGKIDARSARLSAMLNNSIRLTRKPEKKAAVQGILERYIGRLEQVTKEVTETMIREVELEDNSLSKRLEKECKTAVAFFSPSGGQKETPLMRV